jgi:hypothetical protein
MLARSAGTSTRNGRVLHRRPCITVSVLQSVYGVYQIDEAQARSVVLTGPISSI